MSSDELNISNSSEDEDDIAQVPEIDFEPQLASALDSGLKTPDENFRSKHPLFDAPVLIDDKDELNTPERISDDSEDEEDQKKTDFYDSSLKKAGSSATALSSLIPSDDENQAQKEEEMPEWKKFTLPPTPVPDDTEIDKEIREKFDIAKLLQQIRSG